MTINSFVSKSIALILSICMLAPMIAFAQTEPDPVPPVESAVPAQGPPPADDTSTSVAPVVATSTPPDSVQDTAPTQESVTGDTLEGTSNPEDATSTDTQIIPIVEASSTEPIVEEIPVAPDPTPAEDPADIPLPPAEPLTVVADTLTPVVETIAEDFLPLKDSNDSLDPDYVIALPGKVIPTEKKGVLGKSALTSPAHVTVDPVDGSIAVSGSCSNVYFVVLLFRNQTDYDTDPGSYIVNRAMPCVNGAYAYSLSDLPTTIPNGTYYLLIGEQGNTGSWSPATALTEVSINRSN